MSPPADLLIIGAGPTGLTLALQAHAHGATVRVVDRRADATRPSRALILHARTLEVLRPLGVTDALLARADTDVEVCLRLGRRQVTVRLGALDMPDTAFPHLTLMRQMDIERVLLDALAARGVPVERGVEATAVGQDATAAWATLRSASGTETARADAVIGCDGPGSVVRRDAGIGWRGGPYREEILLADLELDGLAPEANHAAVGAEGLTILFPLGERATWRLLATRPAAGPGGPFGQPGPPVAREDLEGILRATGIDAPIATVAWSARYRVQHRLADRFRAGRLFIAGDAAHATSPAIGQGMNTGIQDAANLGWKLALAPGATAAETLLASYDAERRRAARRVLAMTHLAFHGEAGSWPLPALTRRLAPLAAPVVPVLMRRRRLLGTAIHRISGLDADLRGSPLSALAESPPRGMPRPGDRLPDATVTVAGRPTRLHALTASPGVHLLLARDATPPAGVVGALVTAHRLEDRPGAGVLAVRPDGYIGYSADAVDPDALRAWLMGIGAG